MALTGAFTLWATGAAFLLFPILGLPRYLQRAAAYLFSAELLALLVWSYGAETCGPEGCPLLAELAETLAGVDLPLLSVLLYALALGVGIRARRRSPDVAVEHRQHVLATDRAEAHD